MESYRSQPEYVAAMMTYLTGERAEARKAIEDLIRMHPEDASLFLLLGNIKYTLGLLRESAAYYEKALQLSPGFCQAYFKLGVCYVRMGKLNEALTAFKKNVECGGQALELNPSDKRARMSLEQYTEVPSV